MILQETDDYIFVRGNAGRVLLKNNVKDRHEVWLKGKPGECGLIWCFYKRPFWLAFDHVASEAEIRNDTEDPDMMFGG